MTIDPSGSIDRIPCAAACAVIPPPTSTYLNADMDLLAPARRPSGPSPRMHRRAGGLRRRLARGLARRPGASGAPPQGGARAAVSAPGGHESCEDRPFGRDIGGPEYPS